ncbi:PadR family transcriptional regulator [Clostridioides mangenotii]|uniref:PadR family transcriptional regulator n=1 Tax=Metaclostridioides mangenotii TaxID=1540 RepID=UPI002149AAD8|nr:PadR family transcriptional regulator [Clostridioides mangenotii]MCR1954274.1 PadR family transcriptional regulator [Clostridioides mangenotii]
MSTVDLAILGDIYKEPKSAYEIQKSIELTGISKWVKISTPSIYKKTIQLEKKGYLSSEIIKEGRMPEKTIYSITKFGKIYYMDLMKKAASNHIDVMLEFNAVITNINNLSKEDANDLTSSIRNNIEKSMMYLEKILIKDREINSVELKEIKSIDNDCKINNSNKLDFINKSIIKQQSNIFKSLYLWISDFKDELNKNI